MPNTSRPIELMFQAIRDVDSLEELARVRLTASECYAGDDATLRDVMGRSNTGGGSSTAE
jgi:hypothetical protein